MDKSEWLRPEGGLVNCRGGRGFYFEDRYGHLLDVMTVLETEAREEEDDVVPNKVKPIPEGHRTVSPYLAIKNAAEALQFYKKAFGAIERYRLMMPTGVWAMPRSS
jgi:hypothetical protein